MERLNDKYAQYMGSQERYPVVIMTPGVQYAISQIGCEWLIDKALGARAKHPQILMLVMDVACEDNKTCNIQTTWEIDGEEYHENDEYVPSNGFPQGVLTIWIINDGVNCQGRAPTTILLPSEY